MGNVLAASSSTPGSAAASLDKAAKLGMPEPTAPAGYTGGQVVEAVVKDSKLENPGTVEELHKKCKGKFIKRMVEKCVYEVVSIRELKRKQ